jgi:translation initiation factor IF-2
VVAKTIVKNGTLKVGDVVVCGGTYGRVKALHDTLTNRKIEKAGPSMTVNLIGLDLAPEAGDTLYVMDDISKAREIAESRTDRSRSESLSGNTTMVSLEEFQARLESGSLSDDREELVKLNLIIRADVRGSIEAIMKELGKLEHPEVEINVLQASVGGVTRGDVTLAHASQAVVIGFNVVPDESARVLADDVNVEIRRYDIIYKISEDIKATLEGRLRPEKRDVETGSAMVLRTSTISRIGTIAGCRVMRGNIDRDSRIRVIRDNRVIGDYAIETLRREKDDTKDVRQGMECGIKLHGFNDIKEADTLEAYKVEEIARTL